MPTKTHHVKLAKTNQKEIDSLLDILNELVSVHKYHYHEHYEDLIDQIDDNKESFPILSGITDNKDWPHEFWMKVIDRLTSCCMTLMEYCTDPDKSHLDFKPDIKKGLELLDSRDSKDLKLKVFRLDVNGVHTWICAHTNIEALQIHESFTGMQLVEFEGADRVVEVTESEYPELKIIEVDKPRDANGKYPYTTFDTYMETATTADMICSSQL